MQIKISSSTPDGQMVYFESAVGECVGRWMDGPAPHQGIFEVEVDVIGDSTLKIEAAESTPRLEVAGSRVKISGVIESFEDDGVLTLRLGGSLIMVSTEFVTPPGNVGEPLTLSVDSIELWPYSIG